MEAHDIQNEVEFFCSKLREDDGAVHKIVAIKLLAFGAQAVGPLCELLHEPSPSLRQRAVRLLSQISDPCAVEPLCHVLRDGDAEIRETALLALRTMNAKEALPARIVLARHMSIETRLRTLKTLHDTRLPFHPLPVIGVPDVHTICRGIIAGGHEAHAAEAKRVLDHLHDRETLLRGGQSSHANGAGELLHPAYGAGASGSSGELMRPSDYREDPG
jgi:hypothetical protein